LAVEYRPARAQALLGFDLPKERQLLILKNLGCTVEENPKVGPSRVTSPSARLDLVREIDLIEEVARVAGYDLIPSQAPKISSHLSPVGSAIPLENEARSLFHQSGFFEAVNSTFLPADYAQKLRLSDENPAAQAASLLNPIAEDQKVLRPTLLPSLLANAQLNLAHQQPRVALYELNKVFHFRAGKSPAETFRATAVLAGLLREPTWTEKERLPDFYDVKGLAESLLHLARLKDAHWEFGTLGMPYRGPESFRVLHVSGNLLAWGGMLSPLVLRNFGLEGPVAALEIDLTAFGRFSARWNPYRPLPRFPEAWRDIALVVPDGVTSAQVGEGVEASKPPFLVSMALFDQYRGPGVPEGSRSLAFRLRFHCNPMSSSPPTRRPLGP
jgi:phenylalanyl-tRNA synthetase beta chain